MILYSIIFQGVDPVIVLFSRMNLASGRRQWIRSVQRAIHTHDVRSMTLAGPKLLSGGSYPLFYYTNNIELSLIKKKYICILRSGLLFVHIVVSSESVK